VSVGNKLWLAKSCPRMNDQIRSSQAGISQSINVVAARGAREKFAQTFLAEVKADIDQINLTPQTEDAWREVIQLKRFVVRQWIARAHRQRSPEYSKYDAFILAMEFNDAALPNRQ
jgi:hypothetical protein